MPSLGKQEEMAKVLAANFTNNNQLSTKDSFYTTLTRIVMGSSPEKSTLPATNGSTQEQNNNNEKRNAQNISISNNPQPTHLPRRACRAPSSKKFAHPCSCSQLNSNHKSHSNYNSSMTLPAAAYTNPLHLYDSASKKCLPTSRVRDMLLKECRNGASNSHGPPHHQTASHYNGAPCVYDDLVCDARRNRCVCRPTLHLFYESNNTAFGCVPLASAVSPVGRLPCKTGYVYNVISSDCQRIFDVNELPPTQTIGVSATQFSFVTIVLIWLLLFILIATAKLRKCRNVSMYGNSPSTERRHHRGSGYRPQAHGGTNTWLHPFIAAVNGHHHMNQHRTTVDRHAQAVDDSGNFSDTDFFLSNGNRRLNELFSDGTFAGSQQSLNNPPPKFEEIYPSCPEGQQQQQPINIPPPSTEDLPTYDEAMKLQDTTPSNTNQKE